MVSDPGPARRSWQADAKMLVAADIYSYCAYSDCRAACSNCPFGEFIHGSKVAAEAARMETLVQMNFDRVSQIHDEERSWLNTPNW